MADGSMANAIQPSAMYNVGVKALFVFLLSSSLFAQAAPAQEFKGAMHTRRNGRELELIVNGEGPQIVETLKSLSPESLSSESLTLEEVFVATLK